MNAIVNRLDSGGKALVRLRRCYLLLVALLGAATVVLPAIASSETSPTIEATNSGGGYYHAWAPSQAAVGEGGVVRLSNPTEVKHGVEWRSGPETPSCSSGVPVGTTVSASATQWSGTCTFLKAGTYTFYCTVHGPEMTGTVTVSANGTTTTTMTPTTTAPGGSGSEATPGSSHGGGTATTVKLASKQHGDSVHGSLTVSPAEADGRLEVALFATSASLAKAKHPAKVRIGRLLRSSLNPGVMAFAVPLSAKGNSALRRHRRLALTVRIVLTPIHGAAGAVTRNVVLHA